MPPVATRKQIPARSEGVLGEWRDGAFDFDTPEAQQRWQVEAYRNGVHADNWHRGRVLDDKTRDIVLSGLGGATAPVYRGPDGQYRFANAETIEPADIRALRAKSFRGIKLQDLKGPEMPGEDVIATRFAAGRAANDTVSTAAIPAAAPVAMQPKRGIGRFTALAEAQKDASHPSPQEALQAIDDGIRLFANGATIGYADNAAAAANALFGDASFAEEYEKNLSEETARTEAARLRAGTAGAFVEAAPGMIPGYGDALSLVGDTKRYIAHPETATAGNILGSILTALPATPNVLGAVHKVENAAEDVARLEGKVAQKSDDLPAKRLIEDERPLDLPPSKPDQIRVDLNDPASIDGLFGRRVKGNEGPTGHVYSKHVGKTAEELLDRYRAEPRIRSSSAFPNEDVAEEVVSGALQQNRQAILDWLGSSKNINLEVGYAGTKPIGISVARDGTVVSRTNATVVLKKDGNGGFFYHSAFPDD